MLLMSAYLRNKEWYYKNDKGEFVLTDKAPKEAIDDYNMDRQAYIEKVKEKEKRFLETGEVDLTECSGDWLIFPLEDKK